MRIGGHFQHVSSASDDNDSQPGMTPNAMAGAKAPKPARTGTTTTTQTDTAPTTPNFLSLYPNATQMAPRFFLFEENVQEIQKRQNSGGELSIEDGEALKEYDALRDRLAFLQPAQRYSLDGPVAMARLPELPQTGKQPPEQPASKPPPTGGDQPEIQYIGGVRIKTDYSLSDVLGTTANALKSPFGSFIASTRDLVKKATEGMPLTANEEQSVYRYAKIVESFWSLTPAGRIQQLAGSAIDTFNDIVDGKTPPPDQLIDDLRQMQGLGNPMAKGSSDRTVVAGKVVPGSDIRGTTQTPVAPAGANLNTSHPAAAHRNLFQFPRFRIPLSVPFPEVKSPIVKAKPTFNPPTRFGTGQIGYPMSPTKPPRLPAERDTPVPGTSGSLSPPAPDTETTGSETTGTRSVDTQKTTSTRLTGTQKTGTQKTGEGKTGNGATGTGTRGRPDVRGKGTQPTGGRVSEEQWAVRLSGLDLKAVAGKGPINVELPRTSAEDKQRIERFIPQFFFYRNDKDITDMAVPRPARRTDYEQRRDVLVVGNGEDATSFAHKANIYMGKYWGHGPATLTSDNSIIQIGNGRQGVGAIKLPFANIHKGQSVVVTGGAMNGCTMLFASDGQSLYAFHAGTPAVNSAWRTSREGARSIVEANEKIGSNRQATYAAKGNNHDLVVLGRQYPFSALIYRGRYLANTDAVTGAGAMASAVVEGKVPNAALNVPAHAYGPRTGPRWHMMTFNYFEPDKNLRSVGTAEAVVHKDQNGVVTVSVLAEKGSLDKGSSIGERGGPISYKYTPMKSDSAIYTVPAPPAKP